MGRRKWEPWEEEYLEKYYNTYGVQVIANKLDRTKESIKRKAQKLGLNSYICDKIYTKMMAQFFNCDSRVINRWTTKYNLRVSHIKRGNITMHMIDVKEFWKWAEHHKNIIPWHKYERYTLLPEPDWLTEVLKDSNVKKNDRKKITKDDINRVVYLREKRKLTFPQIAKEMQRTLDSVKHIYKKYNKEKENAVKHK